MGEWVASIKSLAADLLAGLDFGLFWLVVERGIEFKEATRGVYHHLGGDGSQRWCPVLK